MQGLQPLQHHNAAHLSLEIAPPNADGLRDADSLAGHVTRHGLQSRAACGDDAHRPGRDHIGKAQRHMVEDRRACVWPHHEQPLLPRQRLECDFILDGDIVTEEEDVQAAMQRLTGDPGGITSRHRDQRDVRLAAKPFDSRAERLGRRFEATAAGRSPPRRLEQRLRLTQGLQGRRGICRPHGNDQVIGRGRFDFRRQQPGLDEQPLVGRRPHDDGSIRNPRQRQQSLRHLQERD